LVELFYSQKTEDKFWGAKLLLGRISTNGSTELAEGSGTLLVSQKPNPFFDFAPFVTPHRSLLFFTSFEIESRGF
jgi:hypothetical protein